MDKNTITGLVLIFLILIGFSYWSKPSKEQLREIQLQDSLAKVEAKRIEEAKLEDTANIAITENGQIANNDIFQNDSLEDRVITLENNNVSLGISTKGGRIVSVDLKQYRTADSLPLMLWTPEKSQFGLSFYAKRRQVFTEQYLFEPNTTASLLNAQDGKQQLTMRLYADSVSYVDFIYTLAPDTYMVDFDVQLHNMENIIDMNSAFIAMDWGLSMPQLEKSKEFENRYTGVYYKYLNDDVDHMSLRGDQKENLTTSVQWVAFKQQFFSSVLIPSQAFNDVVVSSTDNKESNYLKNVACDLQLPYSGKSLENYPMQFYFGPNSYTTLKEYGKDIQLQELVDMGWKWISWFNKYFVIPVFHFLQNNTTFNYGIIILILTLLVKIILFPLTYKSYLSQARMRVLKPQIDEINKKYPADKMMERQQATMNLYKRAGVNPMGGCLPMLIQMPILIALFYFFPGAIELRQQGFLWAKDLASYDSIATLPFSIPFYGDHVSLFCLLMTITNIIYMRINSKNQPQNDQMKGMQTMMYIMPIMFLFIFNNYSSGLSYYYFIATLITILQTWIIQRTVNDEKILADMEKSKSKPVKKSAFQLRLEEMQRAQQQKLRDQKKK